MSAPLERLSAESVAALKRIRLIIEGIPEDAWAEAEQEVSTLWHALDSIDAIVLETLRIDGDVDA